MIRRLLAMTLFILPAIEQLHCARKRSVEQSVDAEGIRWEKQSFENGKKWLGKVTIVNNGSNSAFGFYGLKSDLRVGYFKFTKDYLQYVAADDVFDGSTSGDKVINSWPIEHTDLHQKVSGGRQSNVETENNEITWDKKRFFRVHWDGASISESASFPFSIDESCWSKKDSRLVDNSQEIEDSYISFVIAVDYQVAQNCITEPQYFRADFVHTIQYKYSFVVDEPNSYRPYVYTGENDPLFQKYGYFTTVLPRIGNTGRLENTFLMNRWHPGKTHTFYFADNFPEKYKWIYNDPKIGIIAKTNEIFAREGLAVRFEIKDNDGSKKFGDIRYSFVQFIEDPDYQAPFGYGPTDVHPKTGEIVSAQSIIWISELKYYLQTLKERDDRAADRFVSSSIYREMQDLTGINPKNFTERSAFLSTENRALLYKFLIPDYTYGIPGSAFANKGEPVSQFTLDARFDKLKSTSSINSPELDKLLETSKIGIKKVEQSRANLSDSARLQKLSTIWHFDDAMFGDLQPVLKAVDTDKAASDILYRVAIHEFGHGLNLRHNFYGSVEGSINRSTEKDSQRLKTSSVMDYMSLKDEVGAAYDWEAYDKAALLYAYSDGKIDATRIAKSPFLFCTDEHVAINPLCNQFDSGSSPSEVLVSMIDNYDDSYYVRNFRYGRAFWNTGSYQGSIFKTMLNIKRFVTYYQQAFNPNDALNRLATVPGVNPFDAQSTVSDVRLDLDRTVLLSAAFYAAVMRQKDLDRSFHDSFDNFSGSLTRLGIAADKIFASRFLLGDEGYPLNPNFSSPIVSYVPLRSSPMIGSQINTILSKAFLDGGEMYSGYDNLGRTYFAMNAARYFDVSGERGAIELVRVACFKKNSFAQAFNVNVDAVGNPPRPLDIATLTPAYNDAADPYFRDEPEIAVIRVNSDYYVAGINKNPLAAGLILRGDVNGVINSFLTVSQLTEGRIPECR